MPKRTIEDVDRVAATFAYPCALKPCSSHRFTLQFGVKAANYPLTDDDLEKLELPSRLRPYRARLFGLTIDAQRLAQVRENRRPNSKYATIEQCRWELAQADKLFRRENLPLQNTTHTSIEEIASKILSTLGIEKHLF